ncbi:glycosyltransferase family 2 protein [Thiohalocapsa marina]|uniref:glycosyltransferase family 2 protein n=1 Tax=Thiohalocapsa marina TaxID=424902 RepID=UPI001FE374B3|nr:glycosyltransferase family 2 protein [Thiohalocapsa marina]
MSPKLAVVIVNYNAGLLLTKCVSSVLADEVGAEIIVSDNASTDTSLALLRDQFGDDPRLSILENGANLGFARANNVALGHACAPYVLFLNPDCLVAPGALERMLRFMQDTPKAGMAGCVVRNPDGSEQVASRRVIPDPWIGLARVLRVEHVWPSLLAGKRLDRTDEPLPEGPAEVEAISGAFMLVRREALEQVGPLDEGYFLHCEDLDWFVRFRQAGWKIYLVPDAEAVHYKGACSTRRPLAVLWHKHRGMGRFFRKFQFDRYPLPQSLLVLLGIWAHFALVSSAFALRRLAEHLLERVRRR